MMTDKQLSIACGFTAANQADEREIESIFCGDLLSWVMGRSPSGAAWCTVMGSINSIAVASLSDAACIVLCHGSSLMDDALEKAKQAEINVYLTELSEFDAALAIYKALK